MDKYYFTVPEYASIKRVNISVNKANMLSSKAYKLTTERNYRMKQTKDIGYGTFNAYHIDILEEVFQQIH